VGQYPPAGIAANAQDFGARAQLPVRRVIEHVALEAARREQPETGGGDSLRKRGGVVHAEFDFSFDGHGYP